MELDAIEARLCNWARQYRPGYTRAVCGSIEGKLYRAPWRQWVDQRDIPINATVNWKDAALVESAWRIMRGNLKPLLKYSYMTGFPAHVIARKCGIKVWNLDAELRRAKLAIGAILDKNTELLTCTVVPCIIESQSRPPCASEPPSRVVSARPKQAA